MSDEFVLGVPCRMCRAPADEPCRSYGAIDRDDEYRAWHPHRLRLVDFNELLDRVLAPLSPAVRDGIDPRRARAAEATR